MLFPSSPSPKPPGPSPACFMLLNRQRCRPGQHTDPWGKQERTEVTFFLARRIFPPCHQLLPQDDCPPPQVSALCSVALQTDMLKSRVECSLSRAGQPSTSAQHKHARGHLGCPRLPPPSGRRGCYLHGHLSYSPPAITYPLLALATFILL